MNRYQILAYYVFPDSSTSPETYYSDISVRRYYVKGKHLKDVIEIVLRVIVSTITS